MKKCDLGREKSGNSKVMKTKLPVWSKRDLEAGGRPLGGMVEESSVFKVNSPFAAESRGSH